MALYSNVQSSSMLLQKELADARLKDDRRKKVDDMKKRAIHNAATYDEFRHMVSCAELKTVSRKEMESLGDEKRGWKRYPSSTFKQSSNNKTISSTSLNESISALPPTTQNEFERDWKRCCKTDDRMVSLLSSVGAIHLPKLFRVELDPTLLGQIICLLLRCQHSKQCIPITGLHHIDMNLEIKDQVECEKNRAFAFVQWLKSLTDTGHFKLNVQFLGKKELAGLEAMVNELSHFFEDKSDIALVCNAYGISKK